MKDQRLDDCPYCGNPTILRQKGDEFDRSENCRTCGVLVRVPAGYDQSVTMYMVQVGGGPKEPSFQTLPSIKRGWTLQYQG